jgi:hypothetical protein
MHLTRQGGMKLSTYGSPKRSVKLRNVALLCPALRDGQGPRQGIAQLVQATASLANHLPSPSLGTFETACSSAPVAVKLFLQLPALARLQT